MVAVVQFLHAFAGDMGVDLRGGEVAVAEQHLNDPQVGAVVQQVGRESMPQGVRREWLVDLGEPRVALDDVPERLPCHAIAAARREQVIGRLLTEDRVAWSGHEFIDPLDRLAAERYETLAVALAGDAYHPLVEVHLLVLEADKLGNPQTRRIQHFQHRPIAHPERIAGTRGVDQALDLGFRQRLRQRSPGARHRDVEGRIQCDRTIAQLLTEKTTEG